LPVTVQMWVFQSSNATFLSLSSVSPAATRAFWNERRRWCCGCAFPLRGLDAQAFASFLVWRVSDKWSKWPSQLSCRSCRNLETFLTPNFSLNLALVIEQDLCRLYQGLIRWVRVKYVRGFSTWDFRRCLKMGSVASRRTPC
jgi:hypothetical protein